MRKAEQSAQDACGATKRLAERLADTYGDTVLRISWAYLKSTADAQDVFQDVMLRIMRGDVAFQSPDHEKAWVVRSTINACKNLLGSARYKTSVALDEAFEQADPRDEVGQALDRLALEDALAKLPSSYRAAIHLSYYEGYSIAQIADLTAESTDAVAKRLSRARALLRTYLED